MKTPYFINLILVLVLFGLYTVLNTEAEIKDSSATISELTAEQINHISVKQANRPTIELAKQDDEWLITSPITAPGNSSRVELLLSLLSQPISGQQTISSQTQLAEFGINEQSSQLILNQHQFTFGDTNTIDQTRYILYNNTLYLVNDNIHPLLNTSVTSFIDNQIIPQNDIITELTLPIYQNGTLLAQLTKLTNQDDIWQNEFLGDNEKLKQIITNWQNAKALQVLPAASLNDINWPDIPNFIVKTDKQSLQFNMMLTDTMLLLKNPQTNLVYQLPKQNNQQLLISNQ